MSQQIAENLQVFLRESLRALYTLLPLPVLQLSASIFEFVYHEHILSAIGGVQHEQKERWEAVLYALLSGVLVRLSKCTTPRVSMTAHRTSSMKMTLKRRRMPLEALYSLFSATSAFLSRHRGQG